MHWHRLQIKWGYKETYPLPSDYKKGTKKKSSRAPLFWLAGMKEGYTYR
jgi:hypothetical protein